MKKIFTIITILCSLILICQGMEIYAASISNESFEEVQADINKSHARRVPKRYRYSIKCPKCKVKNYYSSSKLRKRKVYCSNCGYWFRPGIITNRGQRIRPHKKSKFNGAYIKKK